jgi:hypothetical protein
MIYLTYGNQSDGVYNSYVIDICNYMNETFNINIKIIAFISLRNFFKIKTKRQKLYSNSIILPIFPKVILWKLNIITLIIVWLFAGRKKVIALSPIAANLALMLREIGFVKHVIYDGEGATSAEWNEYNVVENSLMKKQIYSIEKNAVINSDFRRAVSLKMVDYWKKKFAYVENKHVVIPCTLNGIFNNKYKEINYTLREQYGYAKDDIVFVYAGSSAGWQSFSIIDKYLLHVLGKNTHAKLLILSDLNINVLKIHKKYPARIKKMWVEYSDVPKYMRMCDYGILIREQSITNRVAAPTKFAEYLSCGLKVLISKDIGDYTEFVEEHQCGVVIKNFETNISLTSVDFKGKQRINALALDKFNNNYFYNQFEKLVQFEVKA